MRNLDIQVAHDIVTDFIEDNIKFDRIKSAKGIVTQSYTVSVNLNANLCSATKHHYYTATDIVSDTKLSIGILYVGIITGLLTGFIGGFVAGLVSGEDKTNQAITGGLIGVIMGIVTTIVAVYKCRKGLLDDIVNYARIFVEGPFVVVSVPKVIGVITSMINSGAAVGVIGGTFIGSLFASLRVSNNKALKAAIFDVCIAFGAIVGIASGVDGETALSRAMLVAIIIVGIIAIVAMISTTGALGKSAVKIVAGIRDDVKAALVGIFIGALAILTYHSASIGVVIGAFIGAIAWRALCETFDDWNSNFFKIVNGGQIIAFLFGLYITTSKPDNAGIFGAIIGTILAGCNANIMFPAQFPDICSIDMFHYSAKFVALAGVLGSVHAVISFKPVIDSLDLQTDTPQHVLGQITTSVVVAFAGAAVGGCLIAILMKNKCFVGFVTGFTERVIQIAKPIGETSRAFVIISTEQSVIQGATGAVIGSHLGIAADLMAGDGLGGAAWGALSGAVTGAGSGIITVVAIAVTQEIVTSAIALSYYAQNNYIIVAVITISAISVGVIGGYFISTMMATGFSIATAVSLLAVMHILVSAREHRASVPLTELENKFERVIEQET